MSHEAARWNCPGGLVIFLRIADRAACGPTSVRSDPLPMPSPRLSPGLARLVALLFFVGALGLVALYAFILFNTRSNYPGTTGGIDPINRTIVWIAFTGICIALGYVLTLFGRQLLGESKGTRRGVKSW